MVKERKVNKAGHVSIIKERGRCMQGGGGKYEGNRTLGNTQGGDGKIKLNVSYLQEMEEH